MKTQMTFRPYNPNQLLLLPPDMARWLQEDHLLYLTRHLKKCPSLLLLAIRNNQDWVYNPIENHILEPDSSLIFMINPEEGPALENIFLNR